MMKKIMIKPGVSRPKITQYINLFYEGHFIKTNLRFCIPINGLFSFQRTTIINFRPWNLLLKEEDNKRKEEILYSMDETIFGE